MLSLVRKLKALILLSLIAGMVGCASIPAGSERSPQDPWESFNRSVFEFNEGLDTYLLKPVVAGYRFILPEFVRDGIYNFLAITTIFTQHSLICFKESQGLPLMISCA